MRPKIEYRFKELRTFYPITGNDLTPMNMQNSSLVTSYNTQLYLDFMRLDSIFKRKTFNFESGKAVIILPLKTIIVPAQSYTGANVSASNDIGIIHDYFEFNEPMEVGVISDEGKKDATSLKAEAQGTHCIQQEQFFHRTITIKEISRNTLRSITWVTQLAMVK